jgi:OOP family OmpA-OmpF porin
MKRTFLTVTLLALPLAAQAQPVTGPYVSLGAGVNFLQNEIAKPNNGYGPLERSYVFDPGVAAFASAGYGLGNGLRIELEGDYLNNHVRKAQFEIPLRAGGYQQQFGGFVNALYDFDFGLPVYPYLGAGVGYQVVELNNVNSSTAAAQVRSGGAEDNGNFAYQGIAGLSYPISYLPGLSLTAEYRFVGVQEVGPYQRSTTNTFISNGVRQTYASNFSNIFNHEILIGLRYAFGSAPPPPPPVAVQQPPAVQPARTYLVFFDWDRADLTDRARQIISQAAQNSTHVQYTRIDVSGNADRSGTPQYNLRLSRRRADNVAAELVRDGVPRQAIDIHAYGDTRPLVPTAAGVREPQNRRVEIVLH